ncbi:MAG: alpha/beta hydrolase [Myxococcota bacterium]|nr:alpha/beta hydrolase [Myxococcota bacterium]
MSEYDPFERGPHPVGVRSAQWRDAARDRTLPVEIWYPASDAHRGEDLEESNWDRYKPMPMAPEVTQQALRDAAPEPGTRPLIVFSHGFGGERRQTTHLCSHWASHGYAVVAMDHVGNTTLDMMQAALASEAPDPGASMKQFIADRPADASFIIDCALAGESGLEVDPARIGMSGHSFGGWTTLATSHRDTRIRAALPLAPAGGRTPLAPIGVAGEMADSLELGWSRRVETLYLVAELDTLLPLEGMKDLLGRTPEPCRGLSLLNADHFHFCDRVEQTHDLFQVTGPLIAGSAAGGDNAMSEVLAGMKSSADLCPGNDAYTLLRGLGVAHMDAAVRDDSRARAFMAQDLVAVMAARGVSVEAL